MHKNIKNLIYIQNEIKSKISEHKIKDYNPQYNSHFKDI